jgi:hypothetical protein
MTDNNRGPATGIALDAESLRAELREAPEAHGLDPEQAAEIAALPDGQINRWIHELAARDDAFWALYDGLRRRTIAHLAEMHSTAKDVKP